MGGVTEEFRPQYRNYSTFCMPHNFVMLFLLSPAKSLDFDTPAAPELPHSLPKFTKQAAQLIDLLRPLKPDQVASLMDLSDTLAALNVARYEAWRPRYTAKNSKQAMLAFNGDVYEGLDAKTLRPTDLEWAQSHVVMLSGLYGALRPLDRMQAYRLEMGTALANPAGRNLYQFWGATLASYLDAQLAAHKQPVIVNLASQEYFKAVDRKTLQARVVDCVFEEYRNGQYKIISFMAKRARGLMARYVIQKRIDQVKKLQGFCSEGYAYDAQASTPDRLVFRRKV